jgi:hypothetical protein
MEGPQMHASGRCKFAAPKAASARIILELTALWQWANHAMILVLIWTLPPIFAETGFDTEFKLFCRYTIIRRLDHCDTGEMRWKTVLHSEKVQLAPLRA